MSAQLPPVLDICHVYVRALHKDGEFGHELPPGWDVKTGQKVRWRHGENEGVMWVAEVFPPPPGVVKRPNTVIFRKDKPAEAQAN